MFCFILTCFTVCSCESSITDTVTTDAFSSVAAISLSHTVNICMCTHIHYTEQIEQRYSWVVKTTTYTRYYDLQLATASFGRFLPNTEVFFRRFGSFVGVSGLRRAMYHAGWFLMACFIWSLVSSMRARSVCRCWTANIVASICASPSYIPLPMKIGLVALTILAVPSQYCSIWYRLVTIRRVHLHTTWSQQKCHNFSTHPNTQLLIHVTCYASSRSMHAVKLYLCMRTTEVPYKQQSSTFHQTSWLYRHTNTVLCSFELL